ncbi:MAG: type II secretion system F family protein [Actinobacteria bacterium]|nr:type II secretion system F family protein [Actinomycetota bacterium]MBU1493152.1 type II secretion system F family protein [Actinomycetota bacterium]
MTTSMMFEFKARDRTGKIHDGQLEATSSGAVVKTLRDRGLMPLSVNQKKASALQRELKIPGFGGKIKQKEMALFSRQLATMVNSGLTLIRSLGILEDQSENPMLKQVVVDVRSKVEQGVSLSVAMESHPKAFSTLYVSMVRAGEVGGALDETLNRLADTLESQARLRSQIKSAMAYPVVVLNLIVFIVLAMLIFVVPIFEKMYADLGGTLPVPTQVLINISRFITSKWWLIGAVIVGLVVGFKRWKATEEGRRRWDSMKLKFPVFGKLTQKVSISRFARTFAVLSRTGVPVLQALDIVAQTAGNAVVSDAVLDVQASVKRGESLAAPLQRHDVFPPMVTQMMSVGEETGALDAMLSKVADFYDREVDDTVAALTSLIEPILIVVMGVVVGGILISLYLPMFNIANLIQSG